MAKDQILFFGPPGTGKTYEAREEAIRIINPLLDNELENNETNETNDKLDLQLINKAFESFFGYDKEKKSCDSKFLNESLYKPGKTCYRNMSAINKFMSILIEKDCNSINRDEFPLKGSSSFAQYSRSVTNFDMATEDIQEGVKVVTLNEKGEEIKQKYINLFNQNKDRSSSELKYIPDFSKNVIIKSIQNTDRTNMSMWKVTIIGALWFIVRNGYIFKYSKPSQITRTEEENIMLKVCLGYDGKDNSFLDWVTAYLENLGLVVERKSDNPRYVSEYYLSSKGEKFLKDLKILETYFNNQSTEGNDINQDNSKNSNQKIYKLKDEFILRRDKLKTIFSQYRDCDENNIEMITLHPSFEYENFIEGISVKSDNENIIYYNKSGVLKEICYKALKNLIKMNLCEKVSSNEMLEEDKKNILDNINDWASCYKKYRELENDLSWDYCEKFVLIIDEINRGDIAKVFGETITLLETDKRLGAVNEQVTRLPFTNDVFGIPKNIYILATMNTSDKSISSMDLALRRRFRFIKCEPKLDLVNNLYDFIPSSTDTENLLLKSVNAIKYINNKISSVTFIGVDRLIGHSYLLGSDVLVDKDLVDIWIQDIIPLLEEYFLDEYEEFIDIIPEKFIDQNTCSFIYEVDQDIIELIRELSDKYDK